MHRLALLLLSCLLAVGVTACARTIPSGPEDSDPVLDEMFGQEYSDLPFEVMTAGIWRGMKTYNGTDYRIYETLADGKLVRLYYEPKDGLYVLDRYDAEPFQIGLGQ